MPVRLNDDQCLLWIKDPSISPYINGVDKRYIYRKNILSDEELKNPRSFLNKVKRKCFHNSALRQKIVDKINEYRKKKTLRLYTLNSKFSMTGDDEYITPPFTRKECKIWAKNHLVNPRQNETTKTNDNIMVGSRIYVELLYTTIQYGMPTPRILNTIPDDKFDKMLYRNANKLIENIKIRLQFIKETDDYFLKHDIVSFDEKLKIESPTSPSRRAAREATKAQNNTFGVSSSSSYKSLNSSERRLQRDMVLENNEEKRLVAEYQYKKGLLPKKEIDNSIFEAFMKFLVDLQNEVINGQLVNNILKDATEGAKARITVPIDVYLRRKKHNESSLINILKENNYDTIEGVISNFINNIYAQLIDSETEFNPDLAIGFLSYSNKSNNFKNAELIKKITKELITFAVKYSFVGDDKIQKYFKNIVEDTIPRDFVEKIKFDIRTKTYSERRLDPNSGDYINSYYKLVPFISDEPKKIRLPEGMGLLIGEELTKAIKDLDEPYFNDYNEHRVLTDNNVLNGFTYEECKKWVTLPIINPRTFKRILIDSPIYNRLLCISYQYDTKLIPRMITSRGYYIILALSTVIEKILKKEGKFAQSRDQLEKYIIDKELQFAKKKEENKIVPSKIGLKWKNVGVKKPNGGIEIINKKLINAFYKLKKEESEVPFYVLFNEEDFAKFGITDITKNSYINIATYYIPFINKSLGALTNTLGLKWIKISDRQHKNRSYIEGIEKEGIEIINKELTTFFLNSKNYIGLFPTEILFSKEDLNNLGITAIAKNSYIKIANYYAPVVEKSSSYIIRKSKSEIVIKKRDSKYIINKYYTVGECLRWASQPNRDPKIPDILLTTDGKEYNAIFEQALVYDYNITPINITPKGIKFMNSVINTKLKLLTVAEKTKLPASRGKLIEDINTKMCIAINNIYDDETNNEGKKYKKFKDKMIEKCEKYTKDPFMCIKDIRNSIEDYFHSDEIHAKRYSINYYQNSAFASLLIYYDTLKGKIYNEEFRDIFIHDFNKFYVDIYEIDDELNEFKKDAIDAGGPKREFFTKLFEELFCDDKNLTRPFISPANIEGDIYCINPNFEPDENFKKVISAYKQNYKNKTSIMDFNKENDYEYIYFVIGKLLCLTVFNELIGLPKQLSTYILAGLINQPSELNYYDILYFYLRDFKTTISYINMINNTNIESVEDVDLSYNNIYIISKSKDHSYTVNEDVEPPIPIKAQLPIDLLRYKMLSTTKDAVKNSSKERKLREYDEKWKVQLTEYEMKKDIYDRTVASHKKADGEKITKENYIKFILQQAKHVVTKNFLSKEEVNSGKNMKKRYDSLFAGFSNEIRKFLYRKKVTIEQLSLLVTNEQLTDTILEELTSNIKVKIEVSYLSESDPNYNPDDKMSDEEKTEKENDIKKYLTSIITQRRDGVSVDNHLDFIRNLLRFWTGLTYYDRTKIYKIFYKYGVGVNVKKLPEAHTCHYSIDFFGFPDEFNDVEREKYIYDKFIIAVGEQEMELH
jgi:hypothetical protein